MALFFLSDVHLRLDRPERGLRLARSVDFLGPDDRLVVVGDLCDFWFASRQRRGDIASCRGLASLRAFRDRGGDLILLPGNHDQWLGPFYRKALGVDYAGPTLDLEADGLRIRATHGHLVGAVSPWKAWMKSRAFLRAFSTIPGPAARGLGRLLDSTNEIGRDVIDRKHLGVYRHYADGIADQADICIFGHIHVTHDDRQTMPRMVVLGGWHHRSSFFRVAGSSAELIVIED